MNKSIKKASVEIMREALSEIDRLEEKEIVFTQEEFFQYLLAILHHFLNDIYRSKCSDRANLGRELYRAIYNKIWEEYRIDEEMYNSDKRGRMIFDFINKVKESCTITNRD